MEPPLHWAVEYDDLESVDLLLKAGAHVDTPDRYGMTPLFYAVTNANAPVAERLLVAGANANGAGQAGDTLLMIAARGNSVDILQALLEKGAAVNAADEVAHQSPLMWAVRANNVKAVKILLDHGAQVNGLTREGQRPERRPPWRRRRLARNRHRPRRLAGSGISAGSSGRHVAFAVRGARWPH